jgi:two-component system, sensor histidine kinase LadS
MIPVFRVASCNRHYRWLLSDRFLLVLLFFATGRTLAYSQIVTHTIAPKQVFVRLADSIEYLRDPSRGLQLHDVLQEKYSSAFQRPLNRQIAFGWTQDAVWVRCRVRSSATGGLPQYFLQIGHTGLDSVSLFVLQNNGQWRESRSGAKIPLGEHEEIQQNTTFPFALRHDTAVTLYVRVVTQSAMTLDMVVFEEHEYRTESQRYDILLGTFLGIVVAALCFNLVIFAVTRRTIYGYYVLYTMAAFCSIAVPWGAPIKIFLPALMPNLSLLMNLSIGGLYFGVWLFGQEFLQARTTAPRLFRVMSLSTWLVVLATILASIFPRYGFIASLTILPNLLLLPIAVQRLRQGNREVWIYVIGWIPVFSTVTMLGLGSVGLIPIIQYKAFTLSAGAISLEVTVFSFLLALQYRRFQNEHQLLEQQQKFERLRNEDLANANERIQRLNEALENRNQEKNELLGIVAHDLKNPIAGIMGLVEVVQDYEIAANTQVSAALNEIHHSGKRMLNLVTNLLDVNRMETANTVLSPYGLNITPLLVGSINRFTLSAEQKGIQIQYNAEEADHYCLGEELALMQVIDNLISNAVKYSPHGKHVFVRVKSSTEAVRVEVQDEGPGISEADMQKLFGKFARLSAQPTGGEHSTGLGLSIVKKMVEAMDGKVWCESELGNGATFIVELPKVSVGGVQN